MVWTKGNVNSINDHCTVDLIELPRLNLSFYAKIDPDGSMRLYLFVISKIYSNVFDNV